MALFRGLADDLPLMAWLNDHIFPAEAAHITPANVRRAVRLAGAELLLAGITTCCDGYFLEDTVAETADAMGLRAVLGQGVIDLPAPGVPDPTRNIAVAKKFVDRWSNRSPLIQPSIFCHSPYTCCPETLAAAKDAAREAGVLFQIHVAETRDEVRQIRDRHGCSPVALLDDLGLLDADTLMVHGVWLDDEDIDRAATRGAAIVHCPESNMKLGAGIAPVVRFRAAGLTVGLGTDGCASNNNLDLFKEMDTVAKLHKAAGGDPTVISATEALQMATIEGARAIGLDAQIGSLEIGKQADVIILDGRHPRLQPCYNPVSQAVYAADGGLVRDTVVAGRIRVRDRRLIGWDMQEILAPVEELARAIQAPTVP
jgi:5-methylthioadenosine/S-adenosylhomocysteine deaminase